MEVVVFGATGNVGTALVRDLAGEPGVERVIGVARRRPELSLERVEWVQADIARDELVPLIPAGSSVVHLAWRIQPARRLNELWRTNVEGSTRVFQAAARAGASALVHASSVGVYSPGPKNRRVAEDWPRNGTPTSFYALHKAEVERRLDVVERQEPELRVVRLRPGLIFQRGAASGQRRLFAGPLLPTPLLRASLAPVFPDVPGLVFQAVHAADVAAAYRLAVLRDVRGPFNIAAEPVLDCRRLAALARARPVRVPAAVLRGAAALAWRLRLQPSPPGWIDMALSVPVLDTTRARTELGWSERRTAEEAVLELVEGLRERAGEPTPPLDPAAGGPGRIRELATGIGGAE